MEINSQPNQNTSSSKLHVHVPNELMPLIPGYLSRRDGDVRDLKIALSKGDYETIGRIGHKLKGNGAGFGFDRITDLGMRMQAEVNEKKFEELPGVISEFEDEITFLKSIF